LMSFMSSQNLALLPDYTRLDETCREVKDAAKIMGNSSLYKKMEEAQSSVKRDIIFAKSLIYKIVYTQMMNESNATKQE
ncbi:4900_t:CDS:2, partial [Cetraspora pellucida]